MPQKTGVGGYSPETNSCHVKRKRKKKYTRKAVLKMLAVMEASQSAGRSNSANTSPPTPDSTTNAQEFLASGRTGRRNALPDILGQHAVVTSSDLPSKLQALSTSDKTTDDETNKPGSSKS